MRDGNEDDLDALRADLPTVTSENLGDRPTVPGLGALLETIAGLKLEYVPWAERAEVVATIETEPRPLHTRDAAVAEELVDVLMLSDVPSWMDPQVNVRARSDVAEIEVEVDVSVGPLWCTVDVLGEPAGAALVGDPSDPRLRAARLPLALVAGHVVQVLLQPPR
jgi:hypothetical protein